MKRTKTFIVCLALCCLGADTQDLPLVYENDFESSIDGFRMTDPKAWEHKDDGTNKVLALVRSSAYLPTVRSPRSIAWIEDLSVSDFVLEVDTKQTGREYGHRDLCIFFGGVDATHYYYVHLATKADDRANSIFIVDGAARTSIATERTDGTRWTDGYHRVRIERLATTGEIRVYFDDMTQPAMLATDTTFTAGAIGFGSFDDRGFFDNVRIRGTLTVESSGK